MREQSEGIDAAEDRVNNQGRLPRGDTSSNGTEDTQLQARWELEEKDHQIMMLLSQENNAVATLTACHDDITEADFRTELTEKDAIIMNTRGMNGGTGTSGHKDLKVQPRPQPRDQYSRLMHEKDAVIRSNAKTGNANPRTEGAGTPATDGRHPVMVGLWDQQSVVTTSTTTAAGAAAPTSTVQTVPGAYALAPTMGTGQGSGGGYFNSANNNNNNNNTVPELAEQGTVPDNSGLAVANPVADHPHHHHDLQVAEEATPEQPRALRDNARHEKKELTFVLQVGALVAILVGIVLIGLLLGDPEDEGDISQPLETDAPGHEEGVPTPSPTSMTLEDKVFQLLPNFTQAAIQEHDATPQAMAFDWLLADQHLETFPQWRIIQRFALATFYFATNGPNWLNNTGWLSYDMHECSWFSSPYTEEWRKKDQEILLLDEEAFIRLFGKGSCDDNIIGSNESVSTLLSNSSSTRGTFKNLRFNTNNCVGSIPPELSLLSALQTVKVLDLGGTLSSHIGQLTHMKVLDLAGSELTGTIPTELGLWTSLRVLNVYGNKLTGPTPTEIGRLSNLLTLYLDQNMLSGTIPTEIGLLSSATLVYFQENANITGTLPTELGLATNLVDLVTWETQISGTIPTELGALTKLMFLDLGDLLTGTIPSELAKPTDLLKLLVWHNALTGTIPPELWQLTSLNLLAVDVNLLSGTISSEIRNLEALKRLFLEYNYFTGSIPSEVGLLATLKGLYAGSNLFSGSVPLELGQLSNLVRLDLSKNSLSGTIPRVVTDLLSDASLRRLFVHDNPGLSGTIPLGVCRPPFEMELEILYNCSNLLCDECDCPCQREGIVNGTVLTIIADEGLDATSANISYLPED